ncbi:jg19928 [Pararge aegeria aegeria]|uniref:Jg19928 protein n=1 Tax=Pararge aegeria aegeria TaxID=348720 RepID=A0A8S4S829_9NEOP|nr:jg19928 [Pararge aegeria aegeria]
MDGSRGAPHRSQVDQNSNYMEGPPGKRYRDRPFTRWDDDIKKIPGPKWIQIAQDRERWHALEDAFTEEEPSHT